VPTGVYVSASNQLLCRRNGAGTAAENTIVEVTNRKEARCQSGPRAA
jgi:hypothetical protein